jgi:hypothetical protein
MRIVCIALVALATASCASEPETVVGEPPPKQEVQVRERVDRIPVGEREPTEAEKTEPEPKMSISGWPFQESGTAFRLVWQGGDKATILFEEPSLNAKKLAEIMWENGEEVATRGTAVAIFQPSVYRATQATRVEGYLYDVDSYRTGGAAVSYDIAAGETVEVYHYKSDGVCYLGVRSRIIEGNCPTQDAWQGNFKGKIPGEVYKPGARIWWVQISTPQASGWVPVDDRFAVDIEDI